MGNVKQLLSGAIILLVLLSSGCIQTPCEKTTDCATDEICSEGVCTLREKIECRLENETCDSDEDCCLQMVCSDNTCVMLRCPTDCDDGDDCTEDECNYSTETCTHTPIVPCCGNNICEEDCNSCPKDCPCNMGNVCEENICVDLVENRLHNIENGYGLQKCRQEIISEFELENFANVLELYENCAKNYSLATGEMETLEGDKELNTSQRERVEVELLVLESKRWEIKYMQQFAKAKEKIAKDALDLILDLKDAQNSLEKSMYSMYSLKNKFPDSWDGSHERLFNYYLDQYQSRNREINLLYNELENEDYKYAFQVDPQAQMVIDIIEKMQPKSDEPLDLALLRYVYSSVDYTNDPDWKTDWVNTPTYTLIEGRGDCDDSAVLLASLFHQGGISGTDLCYVDSDGDGIDDHITVGVYDENDDLVIYESVWEPSDYLHIYYDDEDIPNEPEPIPEEDYPGEITHCFWVEKYRTYAIASMCDDGTAFGECDEDEKPWFCDEGEWVQDCEKCGCPSDYPNCADSGEDKGYCISCSEESIWIEEYSVCCPRGYPYYGPDTDECYDRPPS